MCVYWEIFHYASSIARRMSASRLSERLRFHLLFMGLLVVGAGNSMLLAILPPLVRELALPDSSIGWIFSLSAFVWTFASPLWGRRSDKAGRKPIVVVGLLAFGVSMCLFGLVVVARQAGLVGAGLVFAGMLASRVIFGAFGSATGPAAQAYVADYSSRVQRTERLSALTTSFALGQAVGPAMAGLMASRLGLVFPIFFVAALAMAAAAAIWRHLPEQRQTSTPVAHAPKSSAWRLARDKRLAPFLIFGLGVSVATGVLSQIFTFYLMDLTDVSGALAAELAAGGFMVSALALIAAQMGLVPHIGLSPRAMMATGAAIVCVGVLLQLTASGVGGLMAASAVQGLGFGLARAGYAGGASLAVRADEQGAAAGLVISMNGAGFIFSPLLGGVAYERLGMDAPLYFTAIILVALAAFSALSKSLSLRA